jgi:hypothetical protein
MFNKNVITTVYKNFTKLIYFKIKATNIASNWQFLRLEDGYIIIET